MQILSLFDGMACGMLAMQRAGIEVERYVAFEIDKYATQTSSHNFPIIEHRGDVFHADFTEFSGFDFLVGGSPCTYWSIAQKNGRETEASGMGWELFSQYVRALREAKPMYFIYENNKSMSNAIRESITETFGFEPICINSALVSAQNRQRLYWVGKRNADGTYSKVNVEQPEDRGILLKDILESGETWKEKSYTIDSCYHKGGGASIDFKYQACRRIMAAEPVGTGYRGRMENGAWKKRYEAREDGKANALTTAQTDSMVSEPVRVGCLPSPDGTVRNSQAFRIYSADGKAVNLTAQGGGMGAKTGLYAIPVKEDNVLSDEYWHGGFDGPLVGMVETPMTARNGKQPSQHCRVYSCEDKFVCLGTDARNRIIVPYDGYAVAIEWDENGNPTKSKSYADRKEYPVYRVENGQITIKGKSYPIKLADGFYIIRKLTVRECMRLQTVPEWYEFPVSDTQAYKMLGNGWTVEVIAHLIIATQDEQTTESASLRAGEFEQMSLFALCKQ